MIISILINPLSFLKRGWEGGGGAHKTLYLAGRATAWGAVRVLQTRRILAPFPSL